MAKAKPTSMIIPNHHRHFSYVESSCQQNSAPESVQKQSSQSSQLPRTLESKYSSNQFSLVNDSDYIPPGAATTPVREEEDDVAIIKTPIGIVNGAEVPLYQCPIPGLENLLSIDSTMNWSKVARAYASPKTALSRKRVRNNHDDGDDGDDIAAPQQIERSERLSFYIMDMPALEKFYSVRFKELTMKPLRQIVTAWVKELSPRRTSTCGSYHNFAPNSEEGRKRRSAPWWPSNIPYYEPSHLKEAHLIPLAIDIMMVHRIKDEKAGKRKKPWIATLRKLAIYHVDMTTPDNISSSSSTSFGHDMKKRALEELLPTLFSIAQEHEEYVVRHKLWEGSGNEDPKSGATVYWYPSVRPRRKGKKHRRTGSSRHATQADEEDDDVSVRESRSFRSTSAASDDTIATSAPSHGQHSFHLSPGAPSSATIVRPAQMHHQSMDQLPMGNEREVKGPFGASEDMSYSGVQQPSLCCGHQGYQAMPPNFTYHPCSNDGPMISGSGVPPPCPYVPGMRSPHMSSFEHPQQPFFADNDMTGLPFSTMPMDETWPPRSNSMHTAPMTMGMYY